MIVIGGSLGGMKALRTVLRAFPRTFAQPIAIALHRYREGDDILIDILQKDCPLPVSEVVDKEPIVGGRVYVAPADYHLLVEPQNFSLSTDDPVQYARPSIDVLFESAADVYGSATIGVVLTGANQDGAHGAASIQARGGIVVVQVPASAESAIMPLAAIEATRTPHVYELAEMGPFLVKLTAAAASKIS
jgi:two-component system chemotaxis response regulator CheB